MAGLNFTRVERSAILSMVADEDPRNYQRHFPFASYFTRAQAANPPAFVRGSRVGGSFCVRLHLRFLSMSCAISRWCCKAGKVLPAQSFNLESSPPLA
jgi:hypothetical protein